MDLPLTKSLIALVIGTASKGFFNFCATKTWINKLALTGSSGIDSTGPALAGAGVGAAAAAAAGVGVAAAGADGVLSSCFGVSLGARSAGSGL